MSSCVSILGAVQYVSRTNFAPKTRIQTSLPVSSANGRVSFCRKASCRIRDQAKMASYFAIIGLLHAQTQRRSPLSLLLGAFSLTATLPITWAKYYSDPSFKPWKISDQSTGKYSPWLLQTGRLSQPRSDWKDFLNIMRAEQTEHCFVPREKES